MRRSFSIKEKCEVVQAVELVIAEKKVSCHQACTMIGISQMYYTRFKKAIKKVADLDDADAFVAHKINGTAQKIHPGLSSILSIIHNDLSHFVSETRLKGIQVSTRMVRHEAT